MRKTVLAGFATVVAFGSLVATASAFHAWGEFHWARTANPFTIQLGDNVGPEWDAYLAQAAADWSANTAGNPLNAAVAAGGTASPKPCKPTRGRVEICAGNYKATGWSGLAQIWLKGGHITQATAKMNDYYMSGLPAAAHAHVMCQEVGHTFGLDHQDESGADLNTCMDYADAFDNPHPNYHDYEELAEIYGHVDSTSTIGAAASTGKAGRPGAEPDRVSRSEGPRSSKIVEHFSDGTRKVTFIDWAR